MPHTHVDQAGIDDLSKSGRVGWAGHRQKWYRSETKGFEHRNLVPSLEHRPGCGAQLQYASHQ